MSASHVILVIYLVIGVVLVVGASKKGLWLLVALIGSILLTIVAFYLGATTSLGHVVQQYPLPGDDVSILKLASPTTWEN